MNDGVEQLDLAMASLPRETSPLAILRFGLDNFRALNGVRGRPAGDCVLASVNQRLFADVREHEMVVRLAGDEFAVLLHSVTSVLRAGRAADRLHRIVERPYLLADGSTVSLTACVGVSLCPDDGCDAEMLLRRAGVALRHAKAAGTGLIQFYEPAMETSRTMRHALTFAAPSLHLEVWNEVPECR